MFIELTDELLNTLADKLLAKGESKFIDAVIEKAIEKKKHEIEPLFTVSEVSDLLKTDEATVLRHIKNDILKASKPGKSYIITLTNLQNYINGNY